MINNPRKPFVSILLTALLCAALAIIAAACGVIGETNPSQTQLQSPDAPAITAEPLFGEGITVNGISISAMTMEQAKAALEPVEQALTDEISFILTHEESTYTLDSSTLTINFNTQKILNDAMALPPVSTAAPSEAAELTSAAPSLSPSSRAYTIEYEVDTASLAPALDTLLSEINREPKSASFKIKPDLKTSYSTVVEGYPFESGDGEDGLSVDTDALCAIIIEKLDKGEVEAEIAIPTTVVKPDANTGNMNEKLVLRAVFHTDFSESSSNRKANVKKAAALCNKIALDPGDVFSCNDTIGPRTEGRGWLPAPAVVDGGARTENQAGGGVCQVSTTMYDCVVMSDLQIVYRQNHSSRSSYVDGGLDATINTDTIDFKWKNNTNSQVFLFMWTSGGTLYAAIYAEAFPSSFSKIKFTSKLVEKIDPPEMPTYKKLSELPDGYWILRNSAKSGYKYASYKEYYKGNSRVDTKHVANSTYPAHATGYYVWSGYQPGMPLDPAKQATMDKDGNISLPNPVVTTQPPIETPNPSPLDTIEPPFVTPTPTPFIPPVTFAPTPVPTPVPPTPTDAIPTPV